MADNPFLSSSPAPAATPNPFLASSSSSSAATAENPFLTAPRAATAPRPALPANVAGGSIFTPPDPEARLTPQERAQRKKSQAQGRAVIRTASDLAGAYFPSPNNPVLGATLRDLSRGDVLAILSSGALSPKSATADVNRLLRDPRNAGAANEEYMTLGGKNLGAIRDEGGPPRPVIQPKHPFQPNGPYHIREAIENTVDNVRQYGANPFRMAAAGALEHPYVTGAVSLAADVLNPFGDLPFDVARMAAKGGARAVARGASSAQRAGAEAVDRLAADRAAAAHAANETAASHGPLNVVTPHERVPMGPLKPNQSIAPKRTDRFVAPLANARNPFLPVGRAARQTFDRYAAQVGPEAEGLVHAMETKVNRANALPREQMTEIFGPQVREGALGSDSTPAGLTRAEQMEVVNRSYQPSPDSGIAPHVPDRAMDREFRARMRAAGVPEVRSLDERANLLREALRDRSERLIKHGVAEDDQLYDHGLFFPMKKYLDRGVYAEKHLGPDGELKSLADLKYLTPVGGQRAGFGTSRRFLAEHKTNPPNYLLDPSSFHDEFLPAHQFLHHGLQAERAIGQAKALARADATGIEVAGPSTAQYRSYLNMGATQFDRLSAEAAADGNATLAAQHAAEASLMRDVASNITETTTPARLPIVYAHRDFGGTTTVLGVGDAGRARAMALEERDRRYKALLQAQQTVAPDRPDLITKRRITSVRYLQGLGRGTANAARDLGGAFGNVARAADRELGARAAGDLPATLPVTKETPFGPLTVPRSTEILDQFGDVPRKPGPFAGVQGDIGRVRDDVTREGSALGDVVNANRAAARSAGSDAAAYRYSAKVAREDAKDLEQFAAAVPQSPTQKAILEYARAMHGPEAEEFARLNPGEKSVIPSYVWDGKKWKLAGEFEDVPKRFLDLSKKPKAAPAETSGRVARVDGNLDDVATVAGHADGDALLEWMQTHTRAPKIADYTRDAAQRAEAEIRRAYSESIVAREAKLESLGLAGKTLPEALASLKKEASDLTASARKYDAERAMRVGADQTFGPQARATVAATERANARLSAAMQKIDGGQQGVVRRISRANDRTARAAETQVARLDEIATRLLKARADTKTHDEIIREANRIERALSKSISEVVDDRWGKLPEGYLRESSLRVGARDSSSRGIEKNVGEELSRPVSDPRGRDYDDVSSVMRGFDTLAQLVRFGIVAVPTVHVLGNLGVAHLAEFASHGSPQERAAVLAEWSRIIAGKGTAVKDERLVREAEADGALPAQTFSTFGRYDKREADVLTRAGSELNGLERADQNVSLRFAKPSQQFVFENRERAFAVDAYARLRDRGMSRLQAGREVRRIFGDYLNISGAERAGKGGVQMNRLLLFYPWLKTAIGFWTKKALLDPNASIIAPARAIQVQNSIQGYDDPEKPFTLTAGREESGAFRRVSLPLPQRIVESVGRAAAIPFDLATYPLTGDGASLSGDFKSAYQVPENRLNPIASQVLRIGKNLTGHAAPYERYADPKARPLAQAGQAINAVGGAFVAPLRNIETFGGGSPSEMGDAALSELGLGFSFPQPGGGLSSRAVQQQMANIQRLRAQGRIEEAERALAALRRAQGATL